MTSSYESNKTAYYSWIQRNPEKYRENNRIQQAKKDARKRSARIWAAVCADFRNILIDEVL